MAKKYVHEVYQLQKGEQLIEVMPGREDKRDFLISRGFVWLNEPKPDAKTDAKRSRDKDGS
jgi:hypothetical protein